MHFSTLSGGLLVAASTASAAVVPQAKGGFEAQSVNQLDSFEKRNGPLALTSSYGKFGVPISDSLLNAAQTASLAAESQGTMPNYNHNELYFSLGVGNKGMNIIFDSASADLWVFSTLTDSRFTRGKNLYNPNGSGKAQKIQGATWNLTYHDGTGANGEVYTDTVTFSSLSVQRQAVQPAATVSQHFAQARMDGVMGLAYSTINTVKPTKQSTWFENALPSLQLPIFATDFRPTGYSYFYVGRNPNGSGNPFYSPVKTGRGLWEFDTSSPTGGNFTAIADTATSLILVPDAVAKAYYGQTNHAVYDEKQGGWVYDCRNNLPGFKFAVGSGTITVPSSFMKYAPADGNRCFGSLQSNGNLPYAVLGTPAIRSSYVFFDAGTGKNARIGWSQKFN